MKKIYFTIVLFAIGLIATAIFAAFNYHTPFIGNGGIDSIDDAIYDSGEVFYIEDKKDNLGFPNAERLVSINNNDSVRIGGVSDTPGMLAVTETDGEAGYSINDSTIPPFVWDDSLIAALEIPHVNRSVEIPFVINRIGRAIGGSVPSGDTVSPVVAGDEDINDNIVDLNDPPSDNIDWECIPEIYEDEKDPCVVIEYNYDKVTPHPTPEPATIFLFGSGLIGLCVFGRKKIKRS